MPPTMHRSQTSPVTYLEDKQLPRFERAMTTRLVNPFSYCEIAPNPSQDSASLVEPPAKRAKTNSDGIGGDPQPSPGRAAAGGVSLPVGVGISHSVSAPPANVPKQTPHAQWNALGSALYHNDAVATAAHCHAEQQPVSSSMPVPTAPQPSQHVATVVPQPPGPYSRSKNVTQKAEEERKERNRYHAKRARVKKKLLLESLETELQALRRENERLRSLVKNRIPDRAQDIIGECCYHNKTVSYNSMFASNLHQTDFGLIESLTAGRQSFVLTDPRLPDNPIVYASEGFCELTGFRREDSLGRNCRFLQGPGTDSKAVEVIRAALANGSDATTTMLNYKQDGTPFWNRLFVAALKDREQNIVNYVGVQCAVDAPESTTRVELTEDIGAESRNPKNHAGQPLSGISVPDAQRPKSNNASFGSMMHGAAAPAKPTTSGSKVLKAGITGRALIDESDDDTEGTEESSVGNFGDWSILAEALEADFKDMEEGLFSWETTEALADEVKACEHGLEEESNDSDERYLKNFVGDPLSFTTRTVRSELIDALLCSEGDVTNARFVSALDVLSSMYSSSGEDANSGSSISNFLYGSWRSLSRPSYQNCLGRNESGDFVYTLGTMSFDMFRPGNLTCSIQHTLNHIELVCQMDGAPTAAPWSLRRELASWDPEKKEVQSNIMLKSYDIAVALAIEPGQISCSKDQAPSPSRRLHALQVVHGYMIPDPNTPNRLTVWFTGGKLSPAPAPGESKGGHDTNRGDSRDSENFEEWKAVFGGKHKRTWGESFRVMGAKLFLGAELPDGMDKDGTMTFTLHRPHGGHGKAYVDVLYLDEDVLITRGNNGTIHVMAQSSFVSSGAPAVSSSQNSAEEVASMSPPSDADVVLSQQQSGNFSGG